jgi:hypothetical protein
MTNFSVKGILVLSGLAEEKKFFTCAKIKLFTIFCYLWLQKMVGQKKNFPPLLVLMLNRVPRSGMVKNQDPGHRNRNTA